MAKKGTVTTRATTLLAEEGIPYAVHQYDYEGGTHFYGREAADALGIDPARVFECLITQAEEDPLVAVTPVSTMLNLTALSASVGARTAAMLSPEQAEKTSGYEINAISPVGQRKQLTTVVDISALDFHTIFVSAGVRGFLVELAPEDLLRLMGARTAPIGRQ